MTAVLRARSTGETRGFMKALLDPRTDRILGFTMFGPEAGEVMAVAQTAMLAGMPYTGLRDAILAHPNDGRRTERPLCTGKTSVRQPTLADRFHRQSFSCREKDFEAILVRPGAALTLPIHLTIGIPHCDLAHLAFYRFECPAYLLGATPAIWARPPFSLTTNTSFCGWPACVTSA
jgi:hypothetical protein